MNTDKWETVPCRQYDPEFFYPEGKSEAAKQQAKDAARVCDGCELREACLRMILDFESGDHWHRFGIFAGTTPQERARMAKRQGRRAVA